MAKVLKDFLPNNRAFILRKHGALAWGESLEEALGGIERIEHAAKILAISETLGGARKLSEKNLKSLWKIRKKLAPHIL